MMCLVLSACLLCLALTADSSLLSVANSSNCIKSIVEEFVRAEDCLHLNDHSKKQLALEMTQCLMLQLNKSLPAECLTSTAQCVLSGDSWNTFTTFFAHTDNLCHYYWQLLEAERKQQTIDNLTNLMHTSTKQISKTLASTQHIAATLHLIESATNATLSHQINIQTILQNSTNQLLGTVKELQIHLQQIREKGQKSYSALLRLSEMINQAVSFFSSFEGLLLAQIYTVQSFLYLAASILVLTIVKVRCKCFGPEAFLFLIVSQVMTELVVGPSLNWIIGIRYFRYAFWMVVGTSMCRWRMESRKSQQKTFGLMDTCRMKRAVKMALREAAAPGCGPDQENRMD